MSTTDTPWNDERWARQHSEWARQAGQLAQAWRAASTERTEATAAANRNPGDDTLQAAATAAGKAEIQAARALNTFLDTDAQTDKLAAAISERLCGDAPHQAPLQSSERDALEKERVHLDSAAFEFRRLKRQSEIAYAHAVPVCAEGKVYDLEGAVRWDETTVAGQMGATWAAVRCAAHEELAGAIIPLPTGPWRSVCEEVLNRLSTILAGKAWPAHSRWSPRDAAVWEPLAGRFAQDPAKRTCQLLYPASETPAYLHRHGRVDDIPGLGRVTVVDIDVRALAGAGLSDGLAGALSANRLDEAQARQLLRDTVGEGIALAPPLPPSRCASQVVAALPLEADVRLWCHPGPLYPVVWTSEPVSTQHMRFKLARLHAEVMASPNPEAPHRVQMLAQIEELQRKNAEAGRKQTEWDQERQERRKREQAERAQREPEQEARDQRERERREREYTVPNATGRWDTSRIVMYDGDPSDPATKSVTVDIAQALAIPVEEHYRRFEEATRKMEQENREREEKRLRWLEEQQKGPDGPILH